MAKLPAVASGVVGVSPPARPKPVGSVSKLERIPPKVREEILTRIRIGVPGGTAAVSCGIAQRTFQRWLAFGRKPDGREPYRSFALQVDRAFAEFIVAGVQAMDEGAKKDWRAALEMLKRRNPEDFADPDRAGGTTVNVQVTLEVERRELASRMLDAAARVLGGDPALLERFVAELGAGEVVDGEAVELTETAG